MNRYKKIIALFFICIAVQTTQAQKASQRSRIIILMFDGLRPDYITPELMPNLHAFKKTNSYGNQNHSVYPTVTRVNSASYATGSYPAKHGLLGNTVYFPQVNKLKGLNTGDAKELMKADEVTNHHLLTAVSLGEILAGHGERLVVFSSGSTGQAFLQNHKVNNGAIINPDLILPESFKEEVIGALGTPPAYARPNEGRHKWMMDAFMKYGLVENGPLVNAIWFSDPDGTAHAEGIGSPLAVQSLKVVDQQFGRMLDSIKARGFLYNIIISTDHGFVTHVGTESLSEFLLKNRLKAGAESDDVIIAEGAIYVKDHNRGKIGEIVKLLQKQQWVGPIFTKAESKGSLKGWIEGTVSFDAIHWNHEERAADILVDENWSDSTNKHGYKGYSWSRGVAGHGGFSSWEVHIPLIAGGPSFKKGFVSELPSSNVDIVPTVLQLAGIQQPVSMDGRVLSELFADKKVEPDIQPKIETTTVTTAIGNTNYVLTIERSVLGNHKYVNYTKVMRTQVMAGTN